jgi:hypothetical protein
LAVAGAAVLLAVEGQSTSTTAIPYAETFREVAGIRWLDRAAQVKAESNFDQYATSYIWVKKKVWVEDGKTKVHRQEETLVREPCAYGIAQFTLSTWKTMQNLGVVPKFTYDQYGGRSDNGLDFYDVPTALKAQHFYMRSIEAHFGGDEPKSLGAYNAGEKNIHRAERLAGALGYSGSDAWMKALPSVVGKDPKTQKSHAEETINYVRRIKVYRDEYRKAGLR